MTFKAKAELYARTDLGNLRFAFNSLDQASEFGLWLARLSWCTTYTVDVLSTPIPAPNKWWDEPTAKHVYDNVVQGFLKANPSPSKEKQT